MSQARAILEAEDPKSVFKQAVSVPPPPPALLRQAVAAKEKYMGYSCAKTSTATNPLGETFCYGWFGPAPAVISTLLYFDQHLRQWTAVESGTFEAEDPKEFLMNVGRREEEQIHAALLAAGFEQIEKREWFECWRNPKVPRESYGFPWEVSKLWVQGKFVWMAVMYNGPDVETAGVSWCSVNMSGAELLDFLKRDLSHIGESEDPKSVFKLAVSGGPPSSDKGVFRDGAYLRRLCSRYPAEAVYIWKQEGKFPHREGILQVRLHNYGLVRDEWASFGVLCNSLLNWRNLEGAKLYIDGKHADKVSRNHPELKRIADEAWTPTAERGVVPLDPPEVPGPMIPEAEDPKDFLLRIAKEHGTEFSVGFSIDTGCEELIADNAAQRGLELTDADWEAINSASLRMEGNLLRHLHNLGIETRAEGHAGDNALVGTAWVTSGKPGFKALKLWVDTDGESLRYENLESEELWNGIDDRYRGLFMPRIDFFAYQEVPGLVEEGRKAKPKQPVKPVGEGPKEFFRRLRLERNEAYDSILQYMPKDFVQAYDMKRHAEWHQDEIGDWWPEYDYDDDCWYQVAYYFDYETDDGKLDIAAKVCDSDGNHDFLECAEVGTPAAEALEKAYGYEGWNRAMRAYWTWAAEHGEDPLGYIMLPKAEVISHWLVGFVREGERLKLALMRRMLDSPPSPPAVDFATAKTKAAEDPKWKEALDYCLVDEAGGTEASEADIVGEGGKWDAKQRLVLRFKIMGQDVAVNKAEFIRQKAQAALQELGA